MHALAAVLPRWLTMEKLYPIASDLGKVLSALNLEAFEFAQIGDAVGQIGNLSY
jgi:hypothetical protein